MRCLASKDLKVNVIVNTKTNQLDQLFNKLNNIENKVKKQVKAQNDVTNAIGKTNKEQAKHNRLLDYGITKLKRMAGIYLGFMGGKAMFNTSDIITSAENKLNNINAQGMGDKAYTQDGAYSQQVLKQTQNQLDKMYVSAQKVRMGYNDMMTNASKSMMLANEAFKGNMDNAIRFQEIMAEAYSIGGASAAEQASSMYQMIQGLGSGILQGDELRSVREGAPLAYNAIEQFAQGVLHSKESLKELASQGKITSDMVVAAILNSGEQMDKAFEQTSMTFAQAWLMMKNTALKSFEPVLQKLNDLLNSPIGQAIINGIGGAIRIVANALLMLFTLIEKVVNFISKHSKTIITILSMIATVMAVLLFPKFIAWIGYLLWVAHYYTMVGFYAIASATKSAMAWMAANIPLLILIVILVLVVGALVWVSDSFAQACGYIVGVIMGAVSVIWNLMVMLFMGIVSGVILPLAGAWDAFANFFANIFDDPVATIIHTFETLATAVLGILQNIAKAIDAIFGSNLASAVGGWIDKLGGKADDLAKKYGNGKYDKKSDLTGKLNDALVDITGKFTWNTKDAYNTGYKWGNQGGQWITDKVSGIKDKLMGGKLPNGKNPAYQLGTDAFDPSKLGKPVGNIDKNTGKVADSMKLLEEDLEYLKDVANMEWKKEFTTAEIKIDMNNNNNINGESDLDGLVTKLTDKLYEELDALANGVYQY